MAVALMLLNSSLLLAPLLMSGVPAVAVIRFVVCVSTFSDVPAVVDVDGKLEEMGGKYEKKISLLIHFELSVAS